MILLAAGIRQHRVACVHTLLRHFSEKHQDVVFRRCTYWKAFVWGAFLSVIKKKVIRTSEQHVVTHCVTWLKVGIWCKELVLIDYHKWDGCRVISKSNRDVIWDSISCSLHSSLLPVLHTTDFDHRNYLSLRWYSFMLLLHRGGKNVTIILFAPYDMCLSWR